MLGCYDFCGHYEWTFEWLRQQGGESLVHAYWDQAIHGDSQQHAQALIRQQGIAGMAQYWGHTLDHEGAGYATSSSPHAFRIDMYACPSKGFLLRNGLHQYHDYCDHCLGWIGPMMKETGFTVDHEHNHGGQCWWVMRPVCDSEVADGEPAERERLQPETLDVRQTAAWKRSGPIDVFRQANAPEEKREEG
jgi:hypothetical protein